MHFYPGDFDAFWRRRWQGFGVQGGMNLKEISYVILEA
jgi:hypothetical protein